MWTALAGVRGDEVARTPGAVGVPAPRVGAARGVVLDPALTTAAAVAGMFGGPAPVRLEDPFCALDLSPHGFRAEWEMDVMLRPPGGAPAARRAVGIEPVRDPERLRVVAQTIIDGFPISTRGPAELVPREVLAMPGYTAWLALRDGRPAGAVASYDDGASLGIYLLATLPQHRRRGVGAALLAAAASSAPSRPAVLTATAAGAPLYAACGYRRSGRATWWWRP